MATRRKKKSTGRRRVGSTSTAKELKSYKSNNRTYKKKSCSNTKGGANKAAKSMRDRGMTAQVKKDPKTKKWCVYSAGKSKR
ncbi:MAG: hypothetical protein AAF705_12655 [Bacteroidota bacterium]